MNDSNTAFFSIPLQLLNRCEALILGFLIGNKPFGLYPFLHVHFISSSFNVWFWKSCILPVLNIPQLSVSMTRFLWLLSTDILHSPHSVFCFHRRSMKSSSSESTSFLEHLQWAIPSLLSLSLSPLDLLSWPSAQPPFSSSSQGGTVATVAQLLADPTPGILHMAVFPVENHSGAPWLAFNTFCFQSSGTSARHLYIFSLRSFFW